MGLQNSFVTKISDAVVRTTHLTGLFTDLGIELSHLLFKREERPKGILSTIKLRSYIISFFFMGGIFGGFAFARIGIYSLMIAAGVLITALILDEVEFEEK